MIVDKFKKGRAARKFAPEIFSNFEYECYVIICMLKQIIWSSMSFSIHPSKHSVDLRRKCSSSNVINSSMRFLTLAYSERTFVKVCIFQKTLILLELPVMMLLVH